MQYIVTIVYGWLLHDAITRVCAMSTRKYRNLFLKIISLKTLYETKYRVASRIASTGSSRDSPATFGLIRESSKRETGDLMSRLKCRVC